MEEVSPKPLSRTLDMSQLTTIYTGVITRATIEVKLYKDGQPSQNRLIERVYNGETWEVTIQELSGEGIYSSGQVAGEQ